MVVDFVNLLPEELVDSIFDYVPLSALVQLRKCSKSWLVSLDKYLTAYVRRNLRIDISINGDVYRDSNVGVYEIGPDLKITFISEHGRHYKVKMEEEANFIYMLNVKLGKTFEFSEHQLDICQPSLCQYANVADHSNRCHKCNPWLMQFEWAQSDLFSSPLPSPQHPNFTTLRARRDYIERVMFSTSLDYLASRIDNILDKQPLPVLQINLGDMLDYWGEFAALDDDEYMSSEITDQDL